MNVYLISCIYLRNPLSPINRKVM